MTRRELLLSGVAFALAGPKAFALPDSFFERIGSKAKLNKWEKLPIGELTGRIGIELLGTPYVANTLEVNEIESCVVNTSQLDCVTFYETCLGLARAIKRGDLSREGLQHEITRMRYRGGRIAGYESRLHYTSDWFLDNARRGLVKLISEEVENRLPLRKKLDFMSTHPQSYRQLKADPAMVRKIAALEREISARDMHYIPKKALAAAEHRLQTGDIVGITTTVEGLDCSHTGLCYREGDKLRFMHASSKAKKVILDSRLSDYVAGGAKSTGVIIARPIS